ECISHSLHDALPIFVELPPEQFVDPGDDTLVAAVELPLVDLQSGMKALAYRQDAGGEIRRKIAGTGVRGHVSLPVIVGQCLVGETLQSEQCRQFAGWP